MGNVNIELSVREIIVGIDFGTTTCAASYVEVNEVEKKKIEKSKAAKSKVANSHVEKNEIDENIEWKAEIQENKINKDDRESCKIDSQMDQKIGLKLDQQITSKVVNIYLQKNSLKKNGYVISSTVRFFSCGAISIGENFNILNIDSLSKSNVEELKESEKILYDVRSNVKNGVKNSVQNDYIDIYSIKRLLGKSYDQAINDAGICKEVKKYFINVEGKLYLEVFDTQYSPVQIAGLIFQYIYQCFKKQIEIADDTIYKDGENHEKDKKDEESRDKNNNFKAVICTPVCFGSSERQSITLAAQIGGWQVENVLCEPVAACYKYMVFGHGKNIECDQNVERDQDVKKNITKKKIIDYIVFDFGGGTFDLSIVSIFDNTMVVNSLSGDKNLGGDDVDIKLSEIMNNNLPIARYIKENINNSMNVDVKGDAGGKVSSDAGCDTSYGKHVKQVNKVINQYVVNAIVILDKMLKNSYKKKFDGIILVGGFAKIDYLQSTLRKKYSLPILIDDHVNTLVADGAALYGKNFYDKKYQLFDVLPLSLGIEVSDGIVEKMINRNDRIPVSVVKRFGVLENQTHLKLNIYQGEGLLVKNCDLLTAVTMKLIAPDALDVEVMLSVDSMNNVELSMRYVSKKTTTLPLSANKDLKSREVKDSDIGIRNSKVQGVGSRALEVSDNSFVIDRRLLFEFKKISTVSLCLNDAIVKKSMQDFLSVQHDDYEEYQLINIQSKIFVLLKNIYYLFAFAKRNIVQNLKSNKEGIIALFEMFINDFEVHFFKKGYSMATDSNGMDGVVKNASQDLYKDYLLIYQSVKAYNWRDLCNKGNAQQLMGVYDQLIFKVDTVYLKLVLRRVEIK